MTLKVLEVLGDLLAAEGQAQEAQRVPDAAVLVLEGRPFQLATITSDEAPSPQAKRPGAASAMAARLCARRAGPRV